MLTIEARREKAKELVKGGLSQRQAAKALGVSHQTIMRDVAQDGPESGPERTTTTKAERRVQRELELASKQQALPSKKYGVILADLRMLQ